MLHKLKRRFVLLYTISAGMILLLALSVIFSWTRHQEKQQQIEKFIDQMDQAVYLFQKSIMMNSTEFAALETEHHIILHFEENGKSLYYMGNYLTQEVRDELVQEVKRKAEQEKVFVNLYPSNDVHIKSTVLSIKTEDGQKFLGQAVILPIKTGWQSVIMLQNITAEYPQSWRSWLSFGALGLLSLLGLYLLSHFFVNRTMKPVEEAQAKQVEFIAAASHELKTPLAVIKTCASALSISQERQQEFISDIGAECSRMSKLVDELLLLASAETKCWSVKAEPFALDDFLIEQYEHYTHIVENQKQQLSLSLPEKPENMIYADKNRIDQVLTILLDNASRYAPKESSIELQLEKKKKSYLIKVVDHGIGVNDQQKEHIFERFYRADQARNEKDHYGLGLSIGYELVKRMGGVLHVEDTVGGGATFILEFRSWTQ